MTARSQELLREALALPSEERAQVAWAREVERRARRVMSGESAGEPWEEVRRRIARGLAKR